MKIKTQKILMWIPIVNFCSIVFYWIYILLTRCTNPIKRLIKVFFPMVVCVLGIAILNIIVNKIWNQPVVNVIVFYISSYFFLWFISYLVIKDQEKM